MRGKHACTKENAMQLTRLIPACAGNTRMCVRVLMYVPAHPRMRGKHLQLRMPNELVDGSSPHARETPVSANVGDRRRRLIPACAGNTRSGQGNKP